MPADEALDEDEDVDDDLEENEERQQPRRRRKVSADADLEDLQDLSADDMAVEVSISAQAMHIWAESSLRFLSKPAFVHGNHRLSHASQVKQDTSQA